MRTQLQTPHWLWRYHRWMELYMETSPGKGTDLHTRTVLYAQNGRKGVAGVTCTPEQIQTMEARRESGCANDLKGVSTLFQFSSSSRNDTPPHNSIQFRSTPNDPDSEVVQTAPKKGVSKSVPFSLPTMGCHLHGSLDPFSIGLCRSLSTSEQL
jgi:hypothetical protein